MVMDVLPVDMSGNDKSMPAFRPSHRRFISDTVCFFRCDLSRFEGLPDLISDYISLISSSCFLQIFPFGQRELFFHQFGIALIAAYQLTAIRLFGILCIISSVLNALSDGSSLIQMHSDQPRCSHKSSPLFS